jgi:hypothetical protein
MPAIANGHNIGARSGCMLPPSLCRTRTGRNAMIIVASNSHGTNSMKLRLLVRLRSSAPISPPKTLEITRSYNHPLPELRLTDFGYAKLLSDTRRTQPPRLSHPQFIGPTTSISSGNVINPPPPATALMTPQTMLAIKNKKYVSTIHASILLIFRRGVVAGIVDAGRGGFIDTGDKIHGNASRSTFPPVRIIPTRCPATSIFPS